MGRNARKLHELTLKPRKGQAVVHYRGKDWYFGVWDAERGEPSADAAASFRRQQAAWAHDPAGGMRVGDDLVATLCADWLESADSPAPGTRALGMAREALAWLCDLHGPTPVEDFGPAELAAWQSWLCTRVGTVSRRRFKRATVMGYRRQVERAWRWGVATGRVPAERLAEFGAVSQVKATEAPASERRRPARAADVRATLARLNATVAGVVRLGWHTGARVEELLRLKATDVARTGVIETPYDVRLNLDRYRGKVWAAVLVEHKSAKLHDRVLFFGPKSQKVLLPFLERAGPGGYLFQPKWAKLDQTARQRRECPVRGSQKPVKGAKAKRQPGACYDRRSLYNAVKRAAALAGVPHWFPRQLRQAFARRMISKGVTDMDVASCLGHESRKGVTFRYTDKNLVAAARVYAKWG